MHVIIINPLHIIDVAVMMSKKFIEDYKNMYKAMAMI